MQKTPHQTYSFGEFTLDLTRGCLLRDTSEIKLRPKSFDVLKFLVENGGRLVGKDELIDFAWQGTAVTDDSLVQCLKDIRNALDDKDQTYIKTVPRRGYVFEKDVLEDGAAVYLEEVSSVHVVIEESEETTRREKISSLVGMVKRHQMVASVTLVVLVLSAVAGIVFYRPVLAWWLKPPSIAVMPIVNTTGDAGIDYISDGLTESIITSLTQLNEPDKRPRLRVIATNTVLMFKGKEYGPGSVGRDLGVDMILVAKMFRQHQIRTFKFEMINIADGSIVWAKQYSVGSSNSNELLERQNEIPRDIAAQLPIDMGKDDRENLTRRYTQNGNAYDLYLKGRAEFRKVTPSGLRRSIEYYQQAIDLDPNYAVAYWAMGVSYQSQGMIDERAEKDASEKAIDVFQKALGIDNNLTVAHNAMAMIQADVWDWKAIEKAGATHPAYDRYLGAMGRLDEKLENEKRRLLTAPYAPLLNFNHCNTLLGLRRPDEAIAQCQKTLNIVPATNKAYFGPESPWIHLYLGLAFSLKEMYPEAIAEMKTAVDLGENSKTLLAELGALYAKSGQRDEAIKILEQLKERAIAGEYPPSLNISHIYIALGDKDRAFAWLSKAIDERESRAVNIKFSNTYDSLRDDRRFAELLRRLELPA